jgi:hypothetical protein
MPRLPPVTSAALPFKLLEDISFSIYVSIDT